MKYDDYDWKELPKVRGVEGPASLGWDRLTLRGRT